MKMEQNKVFEEIKTVRAFQDLTESSYDIKTKDSIANAIILMDTCLGVAKSSLGKRDPKEVLMAILHTITYGVCCLENFGEAGMPHTLLPTNHDKLFCPVKRCLTELPVNTVICPACGESVLKGLS